MLINNLDAIYTCYVHFTNLLTTCNLHTMVLLCLKHFYLKLSMEILTNWYKLLVPLSKIALQSVTKNKYFFSFVIWLYLDTMCIIWVLQLLSIIYRVAF